MGECGPPLLPGEEVGSPKTARGVTGLSGEVVGTGELHHTDGGESRSIGDSFPRSEANIRKMYNSPGVFSTTSRFFLLVLIGPDSGN